MAAPVSPQIESSIKCVLTLTQHPEDFLLEQKAAAKKFTSTLKTIYDTTKCTESDAKRKVDTVPALIVKNFDDEQIWQQLELQNDLTISNLVTQVAKLLTNKKKISFNSQHNREIERKHGEAKLKREKATNQNKKKEITDSLKGDETFEDSDFDEEDEDKDEIGNSDSDSELPSDDELTRLKSGVEKADSKDKFFDFTGDSDDDLNFDFGPLGQGEFNEDDSDENDDDDEDVTGGDEDKEVDHDMNKKSKKSVRFKENDNTAEDSKKKKKRGLTESDEKSNSVKETVKAGKTKKIKETGTIKKGSIVDDAFFKLADMEAFLDQEDRREARRQKHEESQLKQKKMGDDDDTSSEDDEEDEDIDIFADLTSEDEDLYYKDFFDPPDMNLVENEKQREKKSDSVKRTDDDGVDDDYDDYSDDDDDGGEDVASESDHQEEDIMLRSRRKTKDLLADSDSEGEDLADILGGQGKQQKSTFEQRQEKLKKKISMMEDEAVSEKPWQLAGEITATNRPENSLLQENVEFEHTARLPPEITEETTKTLEEMIMQRIKDKAFDDVERKIKPKENPFEYKKRITLDQEKSKMSLGEIYEQEYLKQQKQEEEEKTDPDHDTIKKMMQSLFIKLDALSNFHYTPKQAAPEVKIVSNQPSINMEEVAPVSVSDSKLLAPEEVKEKQKGELKGATEKTKTDKLRERKKKKAAKRERQKDKEKRQKLIEKLNPGLGNKYSKERAMRQLEKESKTGKGITVIKEDKKQKTGLTSSKAFFTQLQDEVSAHINSKKAEKRKKDGKIQNSAKKFKL